MSQSKGSTSTPANSGGGADGATRDRQTISLVKGKHTFSFRYDAGEERHVLDALTAMVRRPDLEFDWFDAAVLSHQLGQHLSKELQSFVPKKAA